MWSFTTQRTSGHVSLAGNPKPLETNRLSPVCLSVLPVCCQILLWEAEEGKNCVRNLGRMRELGKWVEESERKKEIGSERWYLIIQGPWGTSCSKH